MAVERLNRLTDTTGATLVLSSDWRHAYPDAIAGRRLFSDVGIRGEWAGLTTLQDTGNRGTRAIAWIDEHQPGAIVVLDDADDGNAWFGERFIHTDAAVGLTDADVDRAIELLGVA